MKSPTMQKHFLRICISILFLQFSILNLKAQWVTIPDTAFGDWLNTHSYSQCLQGSHSTGWQMDTTCNKVVTDTIVNCSNYPIKNLDGIQYFDSLRKLNCSNDSVSILISLPESLKWLYVNSNNLISLPQLPHSLRLLVCDQNELTSLPSLPDSLEGLTCGINSLDSLPPLPPLLTGLTCWHNQLLFLPPLPSTINGINADDNLFVVLPPLPNSLKQLSCRDNLLTTLPILPSGLGILSCGRNQLTILPTLPSGLRDIEFDSNPIVTFPLFPNSLKRIVCANTQTSTLPTLPDSLQILYCNDNFLTSLPSLPKTLTFLAASNNQLTYLPEFPDSLSRCWINDNPNLSCLPELKRVIDFYFSNTAISCLPNYGNITSSTPALNTFPLCDPFNTNGCSVYWNINGKVYNDTSGNCIKDIGETNVQNMKVNLYENGVLTQQNYSGGYGIYSFDTDMGTFETTIDTTGVPFDILCPVSRFDTSVITALDSFDYDKDFAMHCKPGFDVGAWSLVSGVFQPAHNAYIDIHAGDWAQFWGQNCNTNNLSGQLVTTISGAATFISAAGGALTPSVSGNTLTYNISNWSAVNPNTDFNIVVQTDTSAPLGSQICFDVNVTPVAGDNNVSNNHLLHCFTVVSSYDPNEKEVSPVNSVDANDWLTYTIHFQNTGTATAEHIYVTDTLDANVDASTFQLLAYSHQPMVQLKENAVRFNFPNINLPDSNANEALSHGYVQYKVKLKNNLPVGAHINNTAFIYFDFNSAVVTNTTTNTITTISNLSPTLSEGEGEMQIQIYPNPASESATITIGKRMIGCKLSITDILGRAVPFSFGEGARRADEVVVQTSAFASGVYFVTVENERGRVTKKLVVENPRLR